MFDSIFDDVLDTADDAIWDCFSNAVVKVDGHDDVQAIFDNPQTMNELPNGGFIDGCDALISVRTSQAEHLTRRAEITLKFTDGTEERYVVIHPESDGTGETKIKLSKLHGESSGKPDIRY